MQRIWRRSWQRARNKCVTYVTEKTVHSSISLPMGVTAKFVKVILRPAVAAYFLLATISGVNANPTGGQVTTGSGTIMQNGNTMTVTQYTEKLGVNWQNFGIQPYETVNFCQPNAGSVALNRVMGNQASTIYGQLNSNGKVFLVNPNGVLFAPGSAVNVGGLVASTLNITDSDFRAGIYKFSGSSNAAVINQGTISAANGGYVALLAAQAKNEGVIVAQQGSVALVAGSAMTMEMNGNELVRLVIDQGAVQALAENKNLIQADAGKVIMTARAANTLAGTAVNNSGIIRAKSINAKNGSIILDSGEDGQTTNSGTLDASGKELGETGGMVKLLGDKVGLTESARIDVSGDQGGGTVLLGGNYQGKGTEQNASQTVIEKNAVITADALTSGNGGKVVVWANDKTEFSGNISARGGINGGDGGQAEVSGKNELVYQGFTALRAVKGATGSLLLDPADYTIDATNVGTIQTQLAGANVTILSSDGGTGSNGDIFVNTDLTWNSANNLTLSAYHDVNINAPINAGNGASVILRADNTGNGSGTVAFNGGWQVNLRGGGALSLYYNPTNYAAPTNYSGKVSGGAVTAYMLVNDLAHLQSIGTNTATLAGTYALGKDIDASATVTINSNGSGGYYGFNPIGNSTYKFTGVFDGSGCTISNLYINRPTTDCIGLFGWSEGVINNVKLTNVNITGNQYTGGLVGENSGSIANSYNQGSVTGGAIIGGMVGTNTGSGSITNSYNTAIVSGTGNSIGGLVGENFATISDSFNTGAVNGSNSVGGLVGYNSADGRISNSYNEADVKGNNTITGGLVGNNRGNITSSYSKGKVTGIGNSTGGLVGENFGTITDSYSAGTVNGSNSVGGLVGYNNTNNEIISSFSMSEVIGTGNYIGGLVGDNWGNITTSYSTGSVEGLNYVGGLAGNANNDSNITDSYSTGAVDGKNNVGGLTGCNLNIIVNSYNIGSVSGTSSVGGLVGDNVGNIYNSYNKGTVTGSGLYIAGLAGWGGTESVINNSYNTASVTGKSYVGGLVGCTYTSTISNSYNTGQIHGQTDYVGGLTGQNWISSIIEECYNTGSVYGNGNYVGGIAGNNNQSSKIINSYNYGLVNGGAYVGGIAGVNNNSSKINDCYSTGLISGSYSGGLVGVLWGGSVLSSYWDIDTSGKIASAAGISKTTSEMMTKETFSGWDFNNVWGIIPGTSYPYLKFQFSTPPQIISGILNVSGAGGKTIQAAVDESQLAKTTTGANGFYYFALPAGSVPNNSALLTYILNDAVKSNAVYLSSGENITNLSLIADTLTLGSSGSTVTSAALEDAMGSITSATGDILYDMSSNNLTVNSAIQLKADASLAVEGNIALQGITANANKLTLSADNITINGNISSSASGNAIVLTAEHNLIDNGTISINGLAAGRWLVYAPASSSWTGSDLSNHYSFTQYGTFYNNGSGIIPYNSTTTQGSGNGLIYSTPLNFSQSLVGTVEKVYDGTNVASGLSSSNYQISNIPSFNVLIAGTPSTGTYAAKNVGNDILVTAAPAMLTVNDSTGKPVYGFTSTITGGNIGRITPKTLTAAANGTITKEYDGTTAAELGNKYALTGLVSGEEGQVSLLAAGGEYNSKDVLSADKVMFSSISLNGSGASNYSLATDIDTFNDNSGAYISGSITKAKLTIAAKANIKIYDGTVAAAALPTITGLEGTDTVSNVSEIYSDSSVGTGRRLLVSSYSIQDGNGGSNYDVTTMPNDQGVILRRADSYVPSTPDYFKKVTEVFSGAINGRTSKNYTYSDDAKTPFVNIVNKGINSKDVISKKSLVTLYTDSGDEVNVVSVIINHSNEMMSVDEKSLITSIDTASGQMILNKNLPDNLSVYYFGGEYAAAGSGLVTYDGDCFIVKHSSYINSNAKNAHESGSFSLVFDNGQIDTYLVELVGTSLKISLVNKNSFNIARDTTDIARLIASIGLKVAKDFMHVTPYDITEISWNIQN